MKQEDTDALTHIADDLERGLTELRQAVKDMDRVIYGSPVQDKGRPMSTGEINALATVTTEMRKTISYGLTGHIEKIDRIIGRNLGDRSDMEGKS